MVALENSSLGQMNDLGRRKVDEATGACGHALNVSLQLFWVSRRRKEHLDGVCGGGWKIFLYDTVKIWLA